MESKPDRPIIDYANLPHLPREGIQPAANYKYATRSLFLETAPEDKKPDAMWCLAEHEVYAYGKWYPSAWMAYIYATDEYDALRKICGNVRQWEHIKAMFVRVGRTGLLDAWQAEQAYRQRTILREKLTQGVISMAPGYTTAAKILLQLIDAPAKRGRPKKDKEEVPAAGGVSEDARRMNLG